MRVQFNIIWILILLVLNCWVPAVNVRECLPNMEPVGFWYGLWHGTIMVPAFVVSLFVDNIGIYDVNNNGNWYNFGFILGVYNFVGHFIRGVLTGFNENIQNEKR